MTSSHTNHYILFCDPIASQTSTLKGQCIAEFLGTAVDFFGVGCVAALKAGATLGQWEISVIWPGVAMAIYLTAGVLWRTPEPRSDHRTLAICLFRQNVKVVPYYFQAFTAFAQRR